MRFSKPLSCAAPGSHYENTKRVARKLAAVSGAILVSDRNELLETTRLLLSNSVQLTVHGLSGQKWVSDEAARVAGALAVTFNRDANTLLKEIKMLLADKAKMKV